VDPLNALTGFLNRLGLARVAAMVVVAVMLLGFFGFLMFRISTPQMAPIYTGLTFEDSAAIVSELNSMSVPYKLVGDGEAILVPRSQITSIRMSLAENGLPSRGQVGYEVFDETNTLGATSFVQNINRVRALEGELARTITSLSRVKSTRVHLVLPERELFRRDAATPTASIVLDVRGALSAGEIRSIRYLVAAAIEGLSPNAVAVVDTAGTLLASGTAGQDEAGAGTLFQERVLSFETRLRNRIEEIIANVVGVGRVRVQVSAELDLNRMTRTEESYDPDGQVVRSSQTRELSNAARGATTGAVTVANELPGANPGNESGGSSEQSATTEETINYEISKSTMTEVTESGSIKRLSVAVVVDGSYITDGSGASAYQARSEEEIAQLLSLVRSAMGYDQTRGDQLEVVNMQFAERPDLQVPTPQSDLFNFTRDDLFSAAEMAVTLLISLALLFFVVRPLVKRVLKPEEAPLALAAPAQDGAMGAAAGGPGAAPGAPPAGSGPGSGSGGDNDAWMEQASKMGEAQAQTVQRVGELIGENPQQTSMIIRDWLSQAA
jgi:flagellar M-ring protein FliF